MSEHSMIVNQLKAAQGALYAASIAVEAALEALHPQEPEEAPTGIRAMLYEDDLQTMGQSVPPHVQ